jgi:hypothetical protein
MKKHLLVIIGALLLFSVMTFPLVLNIFSYIPGFFSTDEIYAPIWDAWRVKYALVNGLSLSGTDFIAYPFGFDFYKKSLPIGYIWYFINYTLAILTTPALTYNLQIIFNFLLSSFFTYLLTYYLTRSRLAAILSGLVFGFSPYMFAKSWQHLAETYVWQLPLMLLSLFRLKDKDTLKIKVLFIVSLILTSANLTTMYYALLIVMIFLLYIVMRKVNWQYIRKVLILMLVGYAVLIASFLPYLKNLLFHRDSIASGYNLYHRPFIDLFSQSARSLSYFLPAASHPIFGRFTEQLVGSALYGGSFTEHTLYLGWTPLILALVAFRIRRKDKRLYAGENFHINFFVLLAIAAWFFSQPPWWQWGDLRIYMPAFFMYKVLPMFRAYCRFGIVVMLAVAVLAGFGLKFILERFKSHKAKAAVTALFCGLVLFEFWNYPPFKVIDVSKVPAAYYWLKEEPGDFAIAEYPLITNCPVETYKFYQTKHHKKIINGTIPGTPAFEIARTITNISKPDTAEVLKWLGVKYVFVHRGEYLRSDLEVMVDELNSIPRNPGLKLIKQFSSQECPQAEIMCIQKTGPIDIYEVIAKPVAPKIEK